jgi:hypothetical protein
MQQKINSRFKLLPINSRGFSILQVMVAASIMLALSMGINTLLTNHQKQSKSLTQKQEFIDLKNTMLGQLTKEGVCSWQLKDKVFNAAPPVSTTTASTTVISFTQIYQGMDASSAIIARVNEELPGTQTKTVVEGIQFKNIFPTGNADEYKGTFEISMTNRSLTLSLKPVQVSVIVRTDPTSPLSARKIIECTGGSPDKQLTNIGCQPGSYLTGFDADRALLCKELPTCTKGEILRGFTSEGDPLCEKLTYSDLIFPAMNCAPDLYMTGIDTTGNPICSPLPPALPPAPPPPQPANCSDPVGALGVTRSEACPPGQSGSITYSCNPPNWVATANTCQTLPPCTEVFTNPKVKCGGEFRFVNFGSSQEFCKSNGFDKSTRTSEKRTNPAVCKWSGGGWVKFDSEENGYLGSVTCARNTNCK